MATQSARPRFVRRASDRQAPVSQARPNSHRSLEGEGSSILVREKHVDPQSEHSAGGLEQSHQELRQLVGAASHDLQQALDKVMRYLRFVEARYKGRLDSDANAFIASAVDGANRMQKIIADLLGHVNRREGA